MPYPGAVFALAVGVAVGVAVYYYFFNDEKPQQHRQYSNERPRRASLVRTNKEKCCPICLDELIVGSQLRALSCGHVFHSACVAKWIRMEHSCPNCRTYQAS